MFRRCKIMKNANTILGGELKKWMISSHSKMYIASNKQLTLLQVVKKS